VKKKICCHTFLCSHNFHKIENYFGLEVLKKKIWANFQGIIEIFIQKIVTKLSKIWIWDPGSEIRDPKKTYSGSRIQGSKKAPDPESATLEFGSPPGGGHDNGVGSLVRLLNARHLGLALDPDKKGDEEGRRLSGPCLGHSDDVPVGQAYKKILLNQGMKGDEEGRRLSGPCLRHSDDVPVGQAYSMGKNFSRLQEEN
jgi:hypothetical protein